MSNSSAGDDRRSFLKYIGAGALTVGALAVGYASQLPALQGKDKDLQQAHSQVTSLQSSLNSLTNQLSASHPYIYIFSASGTAVVDPTNFDLVIIAAGVQGSFDNHYRDQFGRFWANQATPADVFTLEPKTFNIVNTTDLGKNILNSVGLTPDGKFGIVPVSTANQLAVIDTNKFQVAKIVDVGKWPCDMMVTADGKYALSPDRDSDFVTVTDAKTFEVLNHIQIGDGEAPFMLTASPDSKLAFVENVGYHGSTVPSSFAGTPTGKGKSESFVDLQSQSLIKTIPLDFTPVFDEFTPDGKLDFIFGTGSETTVIDVPNLQPIKSISFEAPPRYITPDPNGKYAYASVKGKLIVIDTGSLEIVQTVQTGVSGLPLVIS